MVTIIYLLLQADSWERSSSWRGHVWCLLPDFIDNLLLCDCEMLGPWCNGYHNYFTLHSTMGRSDTGRGGGTQHCLQTIQPVTACDGRTAAGATLYLGCSKKIGFSIQLLYNWRNEWLNISWLIPAFIIHPECWLLKQSEPVCHWVHCESAAGGPLTAHHNAEHHNESWLLMAIFIININPNYPPLSLPCLMGHKFLASLIQFVDNDGSHYC